MNTLKTINGKSLSEILDELSADIPEDLLKRTYDGYAYFSIQVYQDRLNTVVGRANYDYMEDNLSSTVVSDVTAINVRGTITLKYDDGSICLQRSAYGSENVGVRSGKEGPEKAGKPNDLSNSIKAAATDAFVQCCKKLGIAERQLRDIRSKDKKPGKGETSSRSNNSAAKEYKLTIDGVVRAIGEKGFKASATIDGREKVSLKIWVRSEAYEQITSLMGSVQNFITKYKGANISVIGTRGSYNGEQELEVSSLILKKSA